MHYLQLTRLFIVFFICVYLCIFPLECSKPSVFVEKETKRVLSPPTPVPPQPSRSQPLSKPQVSPVTAKSPPQQPQSPQNAMSLPTVPVPNQAPSCTTSSPLSKPDSIAHMPSVTSPPLPSQTNTEKSSLNAPGLPRLAAHPLRGLPPPALPQDQPPWMALAKKKAKAWSEMPQIVQWHIRLQVVVRADLMGPEPPQCICTQICYNHSFMLQISTKCLISQLKAGSAVEVIWMRAHRRLETSKYSNT